MRITSCLSIFAACAITWASAQIPEEYRGDWLLVNGVVVLQIDEEGTMLLRNSGAKGPIVVNDDGTFIWNLPDQSQSGRFEDGKLFLKSDQQDPPKWLDYLEFRRGSKDVAGEVIEFALRQQTQVANAFERVRRASMEKAILNNLRQLAAAAEQFYLEHGVDKVKLEQIVGPGTYIQTLNPVDGEDYGTLDLTQGVTPWKITSASGITVSFDR